ncbi:MAG: hypothetical protein R3F53_12125 [Gammaproteobacteria bacterium]
MFVTFSADYFASEAEARQEIEPAGLWLLKKAILPTRNEIYWHAYICSQGSKVFAPARELHFEMRDSFTVIIGMSVDLVWVSQPSLRRPEELIALGQ